MGTAYESIYYKNDLSFGVAILNIYMVSTLYEDGKLVNAS